MGIVEGRGVGGGGKYLGCLVRLEKGWKSSDQTTDEESLPRDEKETIYAARRGSTTERFVYSRIWTTSITVYDQECNRKPN